MKETMITRDQLEVPKNVTDAALLIQSWFEEQGCFDWQLLGICSRNHAYESEKSKHKLSLILEVLRRVDSPELCPK